uniref:Uncharacterized protein n=1 Tax=Oryzias sinensis TaxID=183150 RepID=A0A8C7YA63_9TELE
MTSDASLRARDAFISPSAAITCEEGRGHDVSENSYLCSGLSFTSLISTRSTLIPQLSVFCCRDWGLCTHSP